MYPFIFAHQQRQKSLLLAMEFNVLYLFEALDDGFSFMVR